MTAGSVNVRLMQGVKKVFKPEKIAKSFHTDTYCFDSMPEKNCSYNTFRVGKYKGFIILIFLSRWKTVLIS